MLAFCCKTNCLVSQGVLYFILGNCHILFELTGKLVLEAESPLSQGRSKHAYVMSSKTPVLGQLAPPYACNREKGKEQAAKVL